MKEDNKIFWKFLKSKTKAKESIPCIHLKILGAFGPALAIW
jgi:hypothetical protein